jgi:hypothetical protein
VLILRRLPVSNLPENGAASNWSIQLRLEIMAAAVSLSAKSSSINSSWFRLETRIGLLSPIETWVFVRRVAAQRCIQSRSTPYRLCPDNVMATSDGDLYTVYTGDTLCNSGLDLGGQCEKGDHHTILLFGGQ